MGLNIIDQQAVVLAERIACGKQDAEGDLKKVISTIQISEQAHDQIRQTIGQEGYRRVVS